MLEMYLSSEFKGRILQNKVRNLSFEKINVIVSLELTSSVNKLHPSFPLTMMLTEKLTIILTNEKQA